MPLDRSGSKSSVGSNIAAEMASGKGQKQSVAIALSVQRKAKAGVKKPKKVGIKKKSADGEASFS